MSSYEEDFDTIMPFGKHKGERMGDLPSGYLKWLAENIDEKSEQGKKICLIADRLYQQIGEDNES